MTGWAIPRVFGLFRDVYEDGVAVESRPVAWAMRAPDGQVATWSIEAPHTWTMYKTIEDAEAELRAWAGNVDRHQLAATSGQLMWMPEPGGDTAPAAGEGEQSG